MSSKIEIRKLAELACGTSQDSPEYKRFIAALNPTLLLDLTAPVVERQPVELAVWYGAMPESNGKTNWTAILHRKGENLLMGVNITLDRSEYPDRVRYEADRMRYLIGELPDEPDMMAYDENLHSGYVKPYIAPPELAELQATIARLTAENDEPEWHQMMTKLEDQNTELRAEIERLKGGQGDVQMATVPVERCYDVRAKMIIAFNEARKNGGDLDDGLEAAYKSALRYSPSSLPASQPAPVSVVMSFDFEHPLSKEKRTVTLTKQDVLDGMEDYFYDKLGEQICQCESVGETNVVDCNCDEYVHDFEIVTACLDKVKELNQ